MTSEPVIREPGQPSPGPRAYTGTGPSGQALWRRALRWETGLVVVLVAVLVFGSERSPDFLNTTTLFYVGLNMGEIAIMALPLMLIVVTGEIDLSVASMLGLSGAVLGQLTADGWPVALAMVAALAVGALGGALNGVLVARLGLPSIAVTIGTLTLFRGLAEIVVPKEDRRRRLVRLTATGSALLAAALPIWERTHAAIEAAMDGDPDALRAGLRALG